MPRAKENKKEHRGFGFVTYETEAAIQVRPCCPFIAAIYMCREVLGCVDQTVAVGAEGGGTWNSQD